MKLKLLAAAITAITFSACRYGQNEAQQSLETNKKYKSEGIKAEREAATQLPSDAVGKMSGAQTPAGDTTAKQDTTAVKK